MYILPTYTITPTPSHLHHPYLHPHYLHVHLPPLQHSHLKPYEQIHHHQDEKGKGNLSPHSEHLLLNREGEGHTHSVLGKEIDVEVHTESEEHISYVTWINLLPTVNQTRPYMYMHTYSVYLSLLLSLSPVFAHVYIHAHALYCTKLLIVHVWDIYGTDMDQTGTIVTKL